MKRLYFLIRILFDLVPMLWKNLDKKYCDVGLFYTNDDHNFQDYLYLKSKIAELIDPLYGVRFRVKEDNTVEPYFMSIHKKDIRCNHKLTINPKKFAD